MTYHSKTNDNFPKTIQPDPRDLPPALIEITRFIKDDGPLTKHIHLTPSGVLGNDSSDCRMARGTMIRERLDDWRAFAALIEATPRNVAYALGAMRPDLPETIHHVTKKDPQSGHPGFATRTKGTLLYPPRGPALVLCDFDTKGMPAEVRSRLRELGGFLGALTKVCAGFGTAAHVRRKSTSANIINERTGVSYQLTGSTFTFWSKAVRTQGGFSIRSTIDAGSPDWAGTSSEMPANYSSDRSSTGWCARRSGLSLRRARISRRRCDRSGARP